MVVEILRPWRHFQPGAIVATLPQGIVNVLIQRGIAKTASEQPKPVQQPETSQHRKDKRK